MTDDRNDFLRLEDCPTMDNATLVLSFTGWMDGGNVSTGTVERLVDLLSARQVAQIDPEPFYIYNFPGPMEVAALFRPYDHGDAPEGDAHLAHLGLPPRAESNPD